MIIKGILFLLISNVIYASEVDQIIDFSKIRDLIKQDLLEKHVKEQKNKIIAKRKKNKKKKKNVIKKLVPSENEFWSFFSDYWLVKNVSTLKWDFRYPDFGLKEYISTFLVNNEIQGVKFKILLVNTNKVAHFALPYKRGGYIFLLSRQFYEALKLSKLEIAVLFFENYFRTELGFFKNYITNDKVRKFIGSDYYKKKLNKTIINDILNKYSDFIFNKGFSFQQQYKVTNKMKSFFKDNPDIINVYKYTLKKIDVLVKNNPLYKNYNKIYPSPELQLGWLSK